MPRRTNAWSSTIRIFMTSPGSSDGEARDDARAHPGRRSDIDGAADLFGPGLHHPHPEVGSTVGDAGDPAAVVLDLDLEPVEPRVDLHHDVARTGMFRGVRDRLVHDAVRGVHHVPRE